MSQPPPPGDEDRRVRAVELAISNVLRGGILASLVLLATGVVLSFVHHPEYLASASSFDQLLRSGTLAAPSLPGMLVGLAHLDGGSVISLGLLVLILTPVMRVAVSIVGFAFQRNRTFVLITTVVLAVLITSFLLGKAGA